MRQRITRKQLKELTPEQRDRLWKWWEPEKGEKILESDGSTHMIYDILHGLILIGGRDFFIKAEVLPLLSIGQCNELLQTFDQCVSLSYKIIFEGTKNSMGWEVTLRHLKEWNQQDELIDALWQAVKAVL